MTAIDLRECESCGDVVREYPLLAGVVTVVIGALVYAALSVMFDGTVDRFEVGLFAVAFGVAYTAVNYIWRGRTACADDL